MNKYNWVDMSMDDLLEFISTGDPISFQYDGKDYFIEGEMLDNDVLGRIGSYYIADPKIQDDGSFGSTEHIYAESGKFKSSHELMEAAFLDGKTIIERYPELKFFD